MEKEGFKPVLTEIEEDVIKTLQEELKEFSENIQSLKDVLIKQFDSVRLKFVVPLISDAYNKLMDENLEELKDEFLSRIKNSISYLMQGIQNKFSNQLEEISESFEKIEESQKDSIKKTQFENKELNEKNTKLIKELDTKNDLIKNYINQINNLKTDNYQKESIISDLSFIKQKYDSLTKELGETQEVKIKLSGEVSSINKQNEFLKLELQEANNKIKMFEDRSLTLQKNLNEIKSENMFLQNKIKSLSSQIDNKKKSISSNDVVEIKTKIKILEEGLNQKDNQNKELKSIIEKLEIEKESIKNNLLTKEIEINRYSKESEEFKEQINKNTESQKQIVKLQYELNEIKSAKEKQEGELIRIQKLKKMLESEPKFKILQILESVGEIPISTLNTAVGYTSIMTRKILNELAQADLIDFDNEIAKLKKS